MTTTRVTMVQCVMQAALSFLGAVSKPCRCGLCLSAWLSIPIAFAELLAGVRARVAAAARSPARPLNQRRLSSLVSRCSSFVRRRSSSEARRVRRTRGGGLVLARCARRPASSLGRLSPVRHRLLGLLGSAPRDLISRALGARAPRPRPRPRPRPLGCARWQIVGLARKADLFDYLREHRDALRISSHVVDTLENFDQFVIAALFALSAAEAVRAVLSTTLRRHINLNIAECVPPCAPRAPRRAPKHRDRATVRLLLAFRRRRRRLARGGARAVAVSSPRVNSAPPAARPPARPHPSLRTRPGPRGLRASSVGRGPPPRGTTRFCARRRRRRRAPTSRRG